MISEEKKAVKMPHNIILEDRKKMSVSGVSDVDMFDELSVILFTDMGELTIKGENLHINKLSVESGELIVEGDISSLSYSDHVQTKGGFLGKLFK